MLWEQLDTIMAGAGGLAGVLLAWPVVFSAGVRTLLIGMGSVWLTLAWLDHGAAGLQRAAIAMTVPFHGLDASFLAGFLAGAVLVAWAGWGAVVKR